MTRSRQPDGHQTEEQQTDRQISATDQQGNLPPLGDPTNTPLEDIFSGMYDDAKFEQAIKSLARFPELEKLRLQRKYLPGKPFEKPGVMGFRRNGRNLVLTIACEKTMVRQIALQKYIAMVQNMNDPRNATIVLENFIEPDENRQPRGQVLGRLNPQYSCITVAQGLTGRVIHGPDDLVRLDAYYIDKQLLTAFYIASKVQIGHQDTLDELIGAYDGWKAYDLPLDPFTPSL